MSRRTFGHPFVHVESPILSSRGTLATHSKMLNLDVSLEHLGAPSLHLLLARGDAFPSVSLTNDGPLTHRNIASLLFLWEHVREGATCADEVAERPHVARKRPNFYMRSVSDGLTDSNTAYVGRPPPHLRSQRLTENEQQWLLGRPTLAYCHHQSHHFYLRPRDPEVPLRVFGRPRRYQRC